MEVEARMPCEPALHRRRLVGGVIVEDQVEVELRRGRLVDPPQEADELDSTVLEHALADDFALQDLQGGEQTGGTVALVIVGHRAQTPLLQGQSGLRAIQGLDLGLLVHAQHESLVGGI